MKIANPVPVPQVLMLVIILKALRHTTAPVAGDLVEGGSGHGVQIEIVARR